MKADEGDGADRKMFSVCTGNGDPHIVGAVLTSILFCFYKHSDEKNLTNEIFPKSGGDYLFMEHSIWSSSSWLFHRLN